jgi:hypothetical protein
MSELYLFITNITNRHSLSLYWLCIFLDNWC